MYYPEGGSVMELVSHKTKGIPLEPIINAINKAQGPILHKDDGWAEFPVTQLSVNPAE